MLKYRCYRDFEQLAPNKEKLKKIFFFSNFDQMTLLAKKNKIMKNNNKLDVTTTTNSEHKTKGEMSKCKENGSSS